MDNPIELLSDAAIDAVSGGLSCTDAITVARVYGAMSSIFNSVGMAAEGASAAGYAQGVLDGACTPKGR